MSSVFSISSCLTVSMFESVASRRTDVRKFSQTCIGHGIKTLKMVISWWTSGIACYLVTMTAKAFTCKKLFFALFVYFNFL